MRIGRTLPPAAASIGWMDLWNGLRGMCGRDRSLHALEQGIRQHFAVNHVFLVSSGTAALTLTLEALKTLSPRREVVIPAYTCFCVPAAVLKAGLQPRLCDVDPSTFDFDDALLGQTLNGNSLCVIAHHLFGVPSAIERIRTACQADGIFVIEDAAQAMGAESNGRPLGTLGDVGIFSLGRGKNITCGSGGIIVTNSRRIAESLDRLYRELDPPARSEQLKDFVRLVLMATFIRPWLYWIPAALPFLELGRTIFPKEIRLSRLSGMKAGVLRNWQSSLVRSNRGRAEAAAHFSRRLSLQGAQDPARPYVRLPLVVSTPTERERIYSLSQRRGLGLSTAYPSAVNEIPEIQSSFDGQSFPSARRLSKNLLTLPTHQWLSPKDMRAITELCRDLSAA
jgi:dTDP-4-amino-4,6-dideoxygalactose transaminase